MPFLQFDREWTVICTTNAIESINARLRRAVNARGHFPTEQAALKSQRLVTAGLAGLASRAAGSSPGASTVQAWGVGEERAETYLRLLVEAELRRAGDQLRDLDAARSTTAAPRRAPKGPRVATNRRRLSLVSRVRRHPQRHLE